MINAIIGQGGSGTNSGGISGGISQRSGGTAYGSVIKQGGQQSSVGGSMQSSMTRGESAYELAVKYGGFRGSIREWLESLNGASVTISSINQLENGDIRIVLTDDSGDHEFIVPKGDRGTDGIDGIDGISPTITASLAEGGYNLTINNSGDITTIFVANGEKGDAGDAVLITNNQGVIYWKYETEDDTWKELIDLAQLASAKFDEELTRHRGVVFVDTLPAPNLADPNIIYVLREEE